MKTPRYLHYQETHIPVWALLLGALSGAVLFLSVTFPRFFEIL